MTARPRRSATRAPSPKMYPPDGRGESLFIGAAVLELRLAGAERVALRDGAEATGFDVDFGFGFGFGFAVARGLDVTWLFGGFD